MNCLQDQYRQLLAELKLHITEEYAAGSWIRSAPETFEHFKQYALQKASKSPDIHKKPTTVKVEAMPALPLNKLEVKPTLLVPPATKMLTSSLQLEDKVATPSKHNTANSIQRAAAQLPVMAPASGIEKIAKEQRSLTFQRELPQPFIEEDYADITQFFVKRFPQIILHSAPPKDSAAKEFINQWRIPLSHPKVLILTFNENAKEKLFLSNLRYALDTEFGGIALYSADKIERQTGWKELLASQQLSLIIAHKGKMEALGGLMAHYTEDPQPMLGKVRIYPLCDISLYIQEPLLKADLWKALANFLHRG